MAKAILELEMPESCKVCPCCQITANYSICYVYMDWCPEEGRRPDCPLKLVEGKDEQTNVKCKYCNSENVEIIARGTESILYKCKACKEAQALVLDRQGNTVLQKRLTSLFCRSCRRINVS